MEYFQLFSTLEFFPRILQMLPEIPEAAKDIRVFISSCQNFSLGFAKLEPALVFVWMTMRATDFSWRQYSSKNQRFSFAVVVNGNKRQTNYQFPAWNENSYWDAIKKRQQFKLRNSAELLRTYLKASPLFIFLIYSLVEQTFYTVMCWQQITFHETDTLRTVLSAALINNFPPSSRSSSSETNSLHVRYSLYWWCPNDNQFIFLPAPPRIVLVMMSICSRDAL